MTELWKHFYPERDGRFEAEVRHESQANANRVREGDEDREDNLSFDLLYYDSEHTDGIPVDELSSGEIEILSMAGTFMLNKKGFDIVFIDEPELHLHVTWHRAIMRALRLLAPRTQIICATHSGELLDSVYGFERFTILDEADPRVRLIGQREEANNGEE